MARIESSTKNSAGYKGQHRIGSTRELVHRMVDAKGKTAAHKFAARKGVKPATASKGINTFARKAEAPTANYLSIRDLQKLSADTILALPGPTTIKSGSRAVGILVPLKLPDPARLKAALKLADELAKQRDPVEDEAALIAMGVDPTNWTEEAVRKLQEEWLAAK
jgi:hypothetical protein